VVQISSVIHDLPCFGECLLPTLSLHYLSYVYLLRLSADSLVLCPAPFPGAGSAFHLPPPLSGLDYSLLVFSFVRVGGIRLPRGCTGLCSQGWIGESLLVLGSHLLVLPTDVQGRFGACSSSEEIGCKHFTVQSGMGKSFHGLGVQDVIAFDSGCCSISA
jgi:hypothetical protein